MDYNKTIHPATGDEIAQYHRLRMDQTSQKITSAQ